MQPPQTGSEDEAIEPAQQMPSNEMAVRSNMAQ